jgi:hypothetical protein
MTARDPYHDAISAAVEAEKKCWCEFVDIGVGCQKVYENPDCPVCTREGEAAWYFNALTPHIRRAAIRGDAVEAWIKSKRDEHLQGTAEWHALDGLLDAYRLHADCGTSLEEDTPAEGGEAR